MRLHYVSLPGLRGCGAAAAAAAAMILLPSALAVIETNRARLRGCGGGPWPAARALLTGHFLQLTAVWGYIRVSNSVRAEGALTTG